MWLLWLCKWSFLYVYNNSHCSQRVLVIDITWVDTKQKFMWTGKSLCALPVEQNETGQRLNLTLMYKAINYKDVDNWIELLTICCLAGCLGATTKKPRATPAAGLWPQPLWLTSTQMDVTLPKTASRTRSSNRLEAAVWGMEVFQWLIQLETMLQQKICIL